MFRGWTKTLQAFMQEQDPKPWQWQWHKREEKISQTDVNWARGLHLNHKCWLNTLSTSLDQLLSRRLWKAAVKMFYKIIWVWSRVYSCFIWLRPSCQEQPCVFWPVMYMYYIQYTVQLQTESQSICVCDSWVLWLRQKSIKQWRGKRLIEK